MLERRRTRRVAVRGRRALRELPFDLEAEEECANMIGTDIDGARLIHRGPAEILADYPGLTPARLSLPCLRS